jgi:single-stranded-DNA-specific exonuclease
MPDEHGLLSKAKKVSARLEASTRNNENVLIVAHHDADGVCGAAMLSDFVFKHGGHCIVRPISHPNVRMLERISLGKFNLAIFVDLGSGLGSEISRLFGDKWLIIDHGEIDDGEKDSEQILNPWQFGVDGSKEISSSGLCYFVTEKTRNENSAFMAIAGAIGDEQDVGPLRALVGLNSTILETEASTFKQIRTRSDLLLYGRDARPAYEALASTVSCYIPGLTGNKDACLASLRGAGVDLKSSTRWKTVSDFTEEEKHQVLDAVVPHLAGTTGTVEDLVGTVFSLGSEDEYSLMHDTRDFAMLLNGSGRMGKGSIGISMCIGDGGDLPSEVEQSFSDYRTELVRSVQTLMSSADRTLEASKYSIVVGDGVVPERMTGAVCKVLATLNRNKNKVVFLRTTTQDGDVKVSARLGKEAPSCDLGLILREIARELQGVGGGDSQRAGGRFSIAKQQEFQSAVNERFPSKR